MKTATNFSCIELAVQMKFSIKSKKGDTFCATWKFLAHLFPVIENPILVSKKIPYFKTRNKGDISFVLGFQQLMALKF